MLQSTENAIDKTANNKIYDKISQHVMELQRTLNINDF